MYVHNPAIKQYLALMLAFEFWTDGHRSKS